MHEKYTTGRHPMMEAMYSGHYDVCRMLRVCPDMMEEETKITLLHLATGRRSVEFAKKLVKELGVNVNALDRGDHTPLHEAVLSGKVDMVRFLIGAGASIDSEDKYGCTPL